MLDCKFANTPIEAITKENGEENNALVDEGRYQRLVRKLISFTHI